MRAIQGGFMLAAIICVSRADSPPPAPQDFKKYSANKRFYVLSEVKMHRTQGFSSAKPGPIWEIDGYHSILFLSNDGAHLVISQSDGTLLPQDSVVGQFEFLRA